MARCEAGKNDYDKAFTLTTADGGVARARFDRVRDLRGSAPCAHCGIRIVGHGMEVDGTFFGGASGAERKGVRGRQDRV